jgi:NADPH:quinone reductase
MKMVVFDQPGPCEVLKVVEGPEPAPAAGELLVRVAAAGINRADTLHRSGLFPLPAGANPILGVEVAGTVVDIGPGSSTFAVGDRVCGLVDGGGYAELCVMDERLALRVPEALSFPEAAAIPEAYAVAIETLGRSGAVRAGAAIVIHAAASGIGTACLQLARWRGAHVHATAGSGEKLRKLLELGAECVVDRTRTTMWSELEANLPKRGADLVLDCVGGPYLAGNLGLLAHGGELVVIGDLGGSIGSIDIGQVMDKWVTIRGTVLRPRSMDHKARLFVELRETLLPALASRRLQAIVDSTFPLEQAHEAHRRVESNLSFGKIVLTMEHQR